MQVETVKNATLPENKRYLRVATISNKTALCFFYIGKDEKSIQFLSENFESGLTADNFENARNTFTGNILKEIDVVIIDVCYNEKQLREFHSFLKNRDLHSIPVIYNEHHLKTEDISWSEMIDDVIDLKNWQYDFSSKVSFLKKTKEYCAAVNPPKMKVRPSKPVSKRVFDVLIASVLLLLLLPLFLIIAIAVRLESKGPIFYNSKRAGRGFRVFRFHKFRTMEVNADSKIDALSHLNQYNNSNGAKFFKITNDPRITKVGKFLRNTSLDELPQLFNVLKGDMSLVGNRPLPLYEASTLTTNEFVERFMAPAGITGLWQIKKRGKSEMSTEERINLDISYARNSSLLYDLWIMASTPKALMQKTDV